MTMKVAISNCDCVLDSFKNTRPLEITLLPMFFANEPTKRCINQIRLPKTIISILLPLPADDFPASKYDYCYCDSFLKDENAVLIDFISCLVRQQLLFLVTSGQDFSCGHVRKKSCGYFLTLLVKSPL